MEVATGRCDGVDLAHRSQERHPLPGPGDEAPHDEKPQRAIDSGRTEQAEGGDEGGEPPALKSEWVLGEHQARGERRGGDEHGRGLELLDGLAAHWGTQPTGLGKTLWAVFPSAARAAPDQVHTPSRG